MVVAWWWAKTALKTLANPASYSWCAICCIWSTSFKIKELRPFFVVVAGWWG